MSAKSRSWFERDKRNFKTFRFRLERLKNRERDGEELTPRERKRMAGMQARLGLDRILFAQAFPLVFLANRFEMFNYGTAFDDIMNYTFLTLGALPWAYFSLVGSKDIYNSTRNYLSSRNQ